MLNHGNDTCAGMWFVLREDNDDPEALWYIECTDCPSAYLYDEELWHEACQQNGLGTLMVNLTNLGWEQLHPTT